MMGEFEMNSTEKFAKLTFREMVAEVAGQALLELVRGSKWETIFHIAANDICAWRMSQPDVLKMMKK